METKGKSERRSRKDNRLVQKAALVLLIVPTIAMQFLFFPYTTDDAYISFRYSENLVNGKGLVFNEGERVEGFSNPLWVFICAVPIILNFDVVIFSKIIGMIFSLLSLMAVYKLASMFTDRPWIPVLLLSMTPSFALWAVGGLETQMFIFFLLLSTYLLFEDKEVLAGISFLMLSITRHEGAIITLITLIFWFLFKKRSYKLASLFLISYSVFTLLRFMYFGYLFPNTFYYKAGAATLIGSLSALVNFVVYASPFILMALYHLRNTENEVRKYYMILVPISIILISTRMGLWMPGFRLYLPAIPFIYIIAEHMIPEMNLKQKKLDKRIIHICLIVFIMILPLNTLPYLYDETMEYAKGLGSAHIPLGIWMNSNLPADAVIAVEDIGAIPFYSKLYTIDMVGLADEFIAHNGFSADYLFSKSPNVIILLSKHEEIFKSRTAEGDIVHGDDRFQDYSLQQIMTFNEGYHLWIFSSSYEVAA